MRMGKSKSGEDPMRADPQATEADSSKDIGGNSGFGQDRKGLDRGLAENTRRG